MNAYHLTALKILRLELASQPELEPVLEALGHKELETRIQAGVEDFLANPFVQTALSILKNLSKNYKIGQAIKLLEEAGKDYEEAERKKKKKR